MKCFLILVALRLATSDKLDRTYLPPPGAKLSGGHVGDLQTPLEYPNQSQFQPADNGLPRYANPKESAEEPNGFPNIYSLPDNGMVPKFPAEYLPTKTQSTPYLRSGFDSNFNPISPDLMSNADKFINGEVPNINGNYNYKTRPEEDFDKQSQVPTTSSGTNPTITAFEKQLNNKFLAEPTAEQIFIPATTAGRIAENYQPNAFGFYGGNPMIMDSQNKFPQQLNTIGAQVNQENLQQPLVPNFFTSTEAETGPGYARASATILPLLPKNIPTPLTPDSEQKNLSLSSEIRSKRPQAESDRNAFIIDYDTKRTPEGYSYSYDTSNGIHADETATVIDGVKAVGSYSYVGDDGKIYKVTYTADENGFQPRGEHLPTSQPLPEAILKLIEQAAKDRANGIEDDGSYDENKYGHMKYHSAMDRYPYGESGSMNVERVHGKKTGKPHMRQRRPFANGPEDISDVPAGIVQGNNDDEFVTGTENRHVGVKSSEMGPTNQFNLNDGKSSSIQGYIGSANQLPVNGQETLFRSQPVIGAADNQHNGNENDILNDRKQPNTDFVQAKNIIPIIRTQQFDSYNQYSNLEPQRKDNVDKSLRFNKANIRPIAQGNQDKGYQYEKPMYTFNEGRLPNQQTVPEMDFEKKYSGIDNSGVTLVPNANAYQIENMQDYNYLNPEKTFSKQKTYSASNGLVPNENIVTQIPYGDTANKDLSRSTYTGYTETTLRPNNKGENNQIQAMRKETLRTNKLIHNDFTPNQISIDTAYLPTTTPTPTHIIHYGNHIADKYLPTTVSNPDGFSQTPPNTSGDRFTQIPLEGIGTSSQNNNNYTQILRLPITSNDGTLSTVSPIVKVDGFGRPIPTGTQDFTNDGFYTTGPPSTNAPTNAAQEFTKPLNYNYGIHRNDASSFKDETKNTAGPYSHNSFGPTSNKKNAQENPTRAYYDSEAKRIPLNKETQFTGNKNNDVRKFQDFAIPSTHTAFGEELTSYKEPKIPINKGQSTTERIIGEDFTGPKQPQRFDPETGYHYK